MMLCSKCTLVFHLAMLGAVVNSHSFKDILDTVDFADAVVRFAKVWRTSHRLDNVSLSRDDLLKLVERLQSGNTFANGKEMMTTSDEKLSADEIHENAYRSRSKRAQGHAYELSDNAVFLRQQGRVNRTADNRRQKRTTADDDGFIEEQPLDRLPVQDLDYPQLRNGENAVSPSACPACMLQDAAKQLRLEAIKKQILTKLRLSKPPNVSKFVNVDSNPAILRLMNRHGLNHNVGPGERPLDVTYTVDTDESFFAKPMRVIQIAENLPPEVSHLSNSTDSLCYFKFQQDLFRYRIQSAKLSIYIRSRRSQDHAHRMTVILLHTIRISNGGNTVNTTLVKTMNLDLNESGRWHTFDVKQEVTGMAASNVTFKVEAYDHDGRPMAVTHPVSEHEKDKVPILDIRLKDSRRRRQKRQYSRDCDSTSRDERCCRYPLVVDFEQFGWHFVQQPRTFNAYYCSGACEMNHNQHSTAHGHLVEQITNNPYASTGPCCVASKLSARSILYRDDRGTYIYGIIPAMSVEKCGCA